MSFGWFFIFSMVFSALGTVPPLPKTIVPNTRRPMKNLKEMLREF
jgi:hypothetical protein